MSTILTTFSAWLTAERQLGYDLVDECDGGFLITAGVGAQHPQPSAVTGGELVVLLPAARLPLSSMNFKSPCR